MVLRRRVIGENAGDGSLVLAKRDPVIIGEIRGVSPVGSGVGEGGGVEGRELGGPVGGD